MIIADNDQVVYLFPLLARTSLLVLKIGTKNLGMESRKKNPGTEKAGTIKSGISKSRKNKRRNFFDPASAEARAGMVGAVGKISTFQPQCP